MGNIQDWVIKNKLIGVFEIHTDGNSISSLSGGKANGKSILIIPECLKQDKKVDFYLCGDIQIVWQGNSFKNNIEMIGIQSISGVKALRSIEMVSEEEAVSDKLSLDSLFMYNNDLLRVDMSKIKIECDNLQLRRMFYGCVKLEQVIFPDISSKTTDLKEMFTGCGCIKDIDLSSIRLGKISRISAMCKDCKSLERLGVNGLDVSECTILDEVFYGCRSIQEIDIGNWSVDMIRSTRGMFENCISLERLIANNINLDTAVRVESMFKDCRSLQYLDMDIKLSNVIYMNNMFRGCEKLEYVDTSTWNIGVNMRSEDIYTNIEMLYIFANCKYLKSVQIAGNFGNKVLLSFGLSECIRLKYLGLHFDNSIEVMSSSVLSGVDDIEYIDLYNSKITCGIVGIDLEEMMKTKRYICVYTSKNKRIMRKLLKGRTNFINFGEAEDIRCKHIKYGNNGLIFSGILESEV